MNPHNIIPITILALSDYSGETAEKVARAAANQFKSDKFEIVPIPGIKKISDIERVVKRVKGHPSAIFYTLVNPEFRDYLKEQATAAGIPHFDVLGPAIDAIDRVAGHPPRLEPGPAVTLDQEYFRWIEAVQFAVSHDDGADPTGLKKADIVLVGVSRTSKTPLSIYLAYRGWKVANMPLIYGFTPPKELFQVPSEKIIGLTIDLRQLVKVRGQRIHMMQPTFDARYAHPTFITKELKYADSIMKKLNCHLIDVSGKAVEEVAQEIVTLFTSRPPLS